ncbi:SAM-dependent methyltransferase [Aquabacterium sp.]|uniref:class I SAM-dependent methyltransferase n=1 Tax=Aquabacterium sp. TaxID=1872578 RepID=UPI00260256E3|nr:SAM-dependent methyltransferase [Aquabacterium sp.]MDD2977330.1 SAM-dependent methyltransferase [Aquabacterium sp.]
MPASTDLAALNAPALQKFQTLLSQAVSEQCLTQLLLVAYQGTVPDIEALGSGLQRVSVRPVALRGIAHLSFLLRFPTKDITKNLPVAEALALLADWFAQGAFRNAHLHTPTEEVQLAFSKKGKASVRVGKPSNAETTRSVESAAPGTPAAVAAPTPLTSGHNRDKHRFLDPSRPFLHELGVTDARGQVLPTMSRKWKQINKFIEVFAAALARSPLGQSPRDQEPIHVVDFGSGKGYLTFAIHDWLRHTMQRDAHVTGVELRDELVQLCQRVIGKLKLEGMDYEQGDVRDYHPAALNVMIALHACDVATDYAIHLGIRAGADIIMCSPCCHKQIRPQLLSPSPLRPILQHGIHLGQEAEMLTDGLRALLLEAAGYDTQVFEFISLEHTNKNKMILAVKRAKATSSEEVVRQIRDIKAFYGIQEQCLEQLLRADGLLPA